MNRGTSEATRAEGVSGSAELRRLLLSEHGWIGNYVLTDRWYADAEVLRRLGAALASLHPEASPTVILGVEASGLLLAGVVALWHGVGAVRVKKRRLINEMRSEFITRTTPPNYRGRSLALTAPRYVLSDRDRVLFVDDWMETGAQATVVARMVEEIGATWEGASVIVDGCDWATRRKLNVRGLLRKHELVDGGGHVAEPCLTPARTATSQPGPSMARPLGVRRPPAL